MGQKYVLAIDIGTSSTKTAIWSLDGTLVAETTKEYLLSHPFPIWAEIDSETWWLAVCETVQLILSSTKIDKRSVVGIGVDGLGWSLVPIDSSGRVLHPAMIWLDRRAHEEAAWMTALPAAQELVELSANSIDPSYITPKILWLKNHHPEIYKEVHSFLTSSGYMVYKLTGKTSCDYTQAYGYHFFDMHNECWDESSAETLGIPLEKMPPLYQSCDIVGELTSEAARSLELPEGIPVIAGGLDAAVGSFGAGVARLGQTVDQGGQAGGMAMSVDRVIVEPRLIFSHHVLPNQYLLQSGTVGGGSLGWFKRILGQGEVNAAHFLDIPAYELMSRQVDKSLPGAHGLIFLPYMAGERTPIWNNNARGMFLGLSYKTTRGDILRAIMEGSAFANYHNMLVAEEKGAQVGEWIGVGGAAQSDVWCQIKADVTGKPFVLAKAMNDESGSHTLGLTVMVAKALGFVEDLATGVEALLPNRRTFEPCMKNHEMYQDLFEVYLELSNNMLNTFERLAHTRNKHKELLDKYC